MSWWHAPLLGVIQGLTEFLPVSSSGHLALAQLLIPSFEQPGVAFDAVLHVGTALAVVWFERDQLLHWLTRSSGWRLMMLVVVGTLATAALAFPLREAATAAFVSPLWIGIGLLLTSAVVGVTARLPGGDRVELATGWRRAAAVGLAQGLAVFPGLSRSGVTIAAGLGLGLERRWAARFSFLLSVPAIVGVALVELVTERVAVVSAGAPFLASCLVGGVCAALSGYLALRVVLSTITSRVFHRFAWYCLPLGLVVLVVVAWRGL